ncbi:SCO3242 family prenyltransferase [Streptomyces sp. WAC01280]|uniref:SCO3242 family prenyltransferase n=1 Tax=Streptomyces sp. WAC01280 TaxID=2487424 RepID=UPI000F789EF2|nr:UbiA family prenyltransferase [Streptomyces sp. WAC01280]RSS56936.1 4-hydroxybenzoate polyprenyltransferase [Streptomyces sp. WAC01280]
MTGPRALLELVRAPAALTVPGDVLAGAAAAARPLRGSTAGLAAASVCLYWSGMALNDYADREVDAKERPGRPIPSGRVAPRTALAVATTLTGAGLALAAAAGGRRALGVAVPLAATVWAYDLRLKNTPYGPAAMAAARGLDVLMGAGGGAGAGVGVGTGTGSGTGTGTGTGSGAWRRALPAALTVAGHTYALTTVSRKEVEGATASLPAAALATSVALGLTTAASTAAGTGRARRATTTALLGGYLAAAGPAQLQAVARPDAARLQRVVAAGIHALIPLQAALTARHGSPRAVLPLLAAYPLARRLSRKVSPT